MATEKKKVKIDIAEVELDFDKMDEWRREGDEIPVCSFLSIYAACGIEAAIREYCIAHNIKNVSAIDNLSCNFYTLQRMKNFITKRWQLFPINIAGDSKVIWDKKRGATKERFKKPRNDLPKKILASISLDFAQFCPFVDDEMEDNILKFSVFEEREFVRDENTGDELEVIETEQ